MTIRSIHRLKNEQIQKRVLSTTLTDTTSSYPEKKGSTIYTETDTAYYSPSESGFSGSTHSFSTQQNRGETPNQKYVISLLSHSDTF